MEFTFEISQILPDTITTFNGGKKYTELDKNGEICLQTIIDHMGQASAKAQGLKGPITTYSKLIPGKDQLLYILRENNYVVGFIKTGKRRLFLWDSSGLIHEVIPLCVLDFYVHESQQRKGYGKCLFEYVLQKEKVQAFEVAIDRPSSKFLSFLRKHYNLHSYIKQNNNYVVFQNFFSTCSHYDHGFTASGGISNNNRRQSLPSKMTTSNTTRSFSNRMSLSPRRPYSINKEPDSPLSSVNSFSSPSTGVHHRLDNSPPVDVIKDKQTTSDTIMTQPIQQTNGGSTNRHREHQISLEQVYRPANPVPGNEHAPFLTLRAGQTTSTRGKLSNNDGFHSVFDERVNNSSYHNTSSCDRQYSRYETNQQQLTKTIPLGYPIGHPPSYHVTSNNWQKHPWRGAAGRHHFH